MREVAGGRVWSSDQRLTVPTFLRPVDAQVENLIAGIECPTRVVFADPAQPYLPDEVRRRYAATLRDGDLSVMPGTHHLHMETPEKVAEVVAGFLRE